jgi:large subunit ribosomal protein L25
MATATLSASTRADTGKGVSRRLRASARVPGVIYGHARKPQPLAIDAILLAKLLEHISAENTVIELTVDGKMSRTLIREIQRHPFRRQILHVDFQELVAGEKVTVRVPLLIVGIPEGVRTGGGILDQTMRDLEIRVEPSLIPNHIDVDVTALTIGHSIHISDLKLPEGIQALADGDTPVAVCAAPRAIEEVAPVAAEVTEAVAEPELIRKPKGEDEEGEEEEEKKK